MNYPPGTILIFDHLHTNEVKSINRRKEVSDKKWEFNLDILTKQRPMLVLRYNAPQDVYQVLYMTSKDKSLAPKMLVENGPSSFVDCSRLYQYNSKLLVKSSAERISDQAWKKIRSKVPGGCWLPDLEFRSVYNNRATPTKKV